MAAYCHKKKDELQLKLNYQINNFSVWRNIYLCYESTAEVPVIFIGHRLYLKSALVSQHLSELNMALC